MKISLAQIQSQKGDIQKNIEIHKKWIIKAVSDKSDLIVFPELSLSSYEPELAEELAMNLEDTRLDIFQKLSDENDIGIGIGLPIRMERSMTISMIYFLPHQDRICYSKQFIHEDEKPYFVEGKEQIIISFRGKKIAPAICYESLLPGHYKKAVEMGADIYLASVAKPKKGVEKAYAHFPAIAKTPILMVNNIGHCDNFMAYGQSAVWNKKGQLLINMNHQEEGLLTCEI